ncbi:DUF4261 domain-containing protein [Ruminococcus sp.]|uniref:DUF4261 domain-containing protein n=1 Tax=Ruminococcus sp. TaxID=41978 RepID=UPI0025F2A584|nr:DUF4261 domain-containing protein [Ruminococcus sp.]MBQ8965067.1 DUF4261 domain-containing protein [Ruminococcus sp.]
MSDEMKQDLSQQAGFANMLMIYLLFEEKPELIEPERFMQAAAKKFGDIDPVSSEGEMLSCAVKKYTSHFKDADIPPIALLAQGLEFDSSKYGELVRTQLWDMPDGGEILDKCRYSCFISDMMGGAALDYRDRCEMLMDMLEVALELFPQCKAVWTPTAGKLILPEKLLNGKVPRDQRFIFTCVNARFFNISGTNGDMVVDTLGMYAVDLPDVQLHFNGLDPNDVTNYVYNICIYNFANNAPIKSGETIDGLDKSGNISHEVMWRCQYEDALIQPARPVLDIEAGEYAAGRR